MEQALLNLVNGVPIAAAVLYVWIISDRNHTNEIASWRKTVEAKDAALDDMKEAINELTTQIQTLTYIIETYVTGNGKASTRRKNKQTQTRS